MCAPAFIIIDDLALEVRSEKFELDSESACKRGHFAFYLGKSHRAVLLAALSEHIEIYAVYCQDLHDYD